ncbi:hypothetical protein [Salinicoccus albus]|uniref:response regulator transcription factor n=1 Tax=Salinicoccus albus TaxID=418756 RepID=UPI0003A6232A
MKLLIVDDDPLICQSLKLLLSKEVDFENVETAQNGQEAVDFCDRDVPRCHIDGSADARHGWDRKYQNH